MYCKKVFILVSDLIKTCISWENILLYQGMVILLAERLLEFSGNACNF